MFNFSEGESNFIELGYSVPSGSAENTTSKVTISDGSDKKVLTE
jgi:hypothetical protein